MSARGTSLNGMPLVSAGILLYRVTDDGLEVLLGHPGGPFYARKDDDTWTVFKGELDGNEDRYAVALREFEEETGHLPPPDADPIDLGEIVQRGGKHVVAWALEGDLDPADAASNTFEMEWPPRSGRTAEFPEIDRVGWFDLATAGGKIRAAQRPFLGAARGRARLVLVRRADHVDPRVVAGVLVA